MLLLYSLRQYYLAGVKLYFTCKLFSSRVYLAATSARSYLPILLPLANAPLKYLCAQISGFERGPIAATARERVPRVD